MRRRCRRISKRLADEENSGAAGLLRARAAGPDPREALGGRGRHGPD